VKPPSAPLRLFWRAAGLAAAALGVIGMALPVMPTVPFMLLAAFCFARSNPAWEARLLADPRFGPAIRAWRTRRAIGRRAKLAALLGLAGSAVMGLMFVAAPWSFVPLGVALLVGPWLLTRPDA
jgi:uncharacterized membrane protein YbaN (DUF454 family)